MKLSKDGAPGYAGGMRDETRLIRATLSEAKAGKPLHAGPAFAAPFHAAGDPAGVEYTYARSHNPTWTHMEKAIAGLEGDGAGVRVFASGMAAVAAVFGAVLRPGDRVAIQEGVYYGGRNLLKERFEVVGVSVRGVKAAELTDPAAVAGARLVWVETPSNPGLEIVDIAAVARVAHAAGALLAVDNTTATPLGQKPLRLGADLSVCSDSKSMGGHSDLLLGHVAVLDEVLLEAIDRQRTLTGGIAGPMEAWLAVRSLATLPLRLERSSSNALWLAEFLAGRKEVSEVLYAGLKSHAGYEIAAAQMTHFGAVVGFTLSSKEAAEKFLERAELVTQATSFGGVSTTAERRGRWGHDDIAPGFIRLSAGCEAIEDLIEDFARALDSLAGTHS
jgi:cystathionine gamma-lyase